MTISYQAFLARWVKRLSWQETARVFETSWNTVFRAVQFVCSNMWAAYLKVIAKKAPQALNLLDRFHMMRKFNEAIDEIRRSEIKQFKANGQDNVLENWVTRTLQTDLEPMKKVAKMLRRHKPLILNWFKAKLTMRKAYGFRTLKCLQIALYHKLGKLPGPDYFHGFC